MASMVAASPRWICDTRHGVAHRLSELGLDQPVA
jgi:hypothetical protein